ncbi:hypothetical protein H4R34_000394 [Dimargaris verticillata]|uniref:Bola-like protein n=1 Tax=Dimargaris verticillata TaxID=2761393 RepID=A0A9W8EBX0_9FUNG|nr:hypothetical protein H4R34_000394 [Dimargaris verticillata]
MASRLARFRVSALRTNPPLLRLYSAGATVTLNEQRITKKLLDALQPQTLEVTDISGGCGAMFRIKIGSAQFKGVPLVRQHRQVNEILKDEIAGMHGLQLETFAAAPKETSS